MYSKISKQQSKVSYVFVSIIWLKIRKIESFYSLFLVRDYFYMNLHIIYPGLFFTIREILMHDGYNICLVPTNNLDMHLWRKYLYSRFRDVDKLYSNQFFKTYSERLHTLEPMIIQQARDKFGQDFKVRVN